ncbi:ATP-binding cassette sub-family A member 3 [Reticulomyxa filosa]|uniref:ATP-binding cassette sub-family A member 3 n=1 Tax=Reticulomyxa filosa TaxID=46433 RepID=X6NNK7_RETFI|nr:ATP-binding cassette sub-family A member 3 [Reticulomyxa filosa]|eukprot:ETO27513.1 ATP-binding cassette sub-family A member 3 [Reticulomyxa filosa]
MSEFKTQLFEETDENENKIVGFWSMTWLLIWKNYVSHCKRAQFAFIFKILCPVFFFVILALLRLAVPTANVATQYGFEFDNYNADLRIDVQSDLCSSHYDFTFGNVTAIGDPMYVAIVPNPNTDPSSLLSQHIRGLLHIMQKNWRNFSDFSFCELIKFFDSSEDLYQYLTSNYYGYGWNLKNTGEGYRPVGLAIEFKSVSDDGQQWSYSLRVNQSTQIPSTDSGNIVDSFTKDLTTLWYEGAGGYISSPFLNWQYFVDTSIAQYVGNVSAQSYDSHYTTKMAKGYHVFPITEYVTDPYWPNLDFLFVLFVVIGFVYPFAQVTSHLIQEKALQTKEGMKMMGATVMTYWASWYCWLWFEWTLTMVLCFVAMYVGHVCKYSDGFLIFAWLYCFGMSIMALATLASTLFDNSRMGLVFAILVLLVTTFAGYAHSALDTENQKNGLCLLSPACLTISVSLLTEFESGAVGINWLTVSEEYDKFRFGTSIWMFCIDTCLYIVLTLYLDRVWPSRYGQRLPWYFLFTKQFWCDLRSSTVHTTQDVATSSLERISSLADKNGYEKVKEVDVTTRPMIQVRDLYKVFQDPLQRSQVKAVNGVSLDIYSGEVFCLLGHNGAGKTTCIGMLTGLLTITEGHAFISGHNVSTDMPRIRTTLGVCPQKVFFLVPAEIDKTLNTCGLEDKKYYFPMQLSGGQKRKLSLGIAFIGGSQVVFLDEVTFYPSHIFDITST